MQMDLSITGPKNDNKNEYINEKMRVHEINNVRM